MWLFIILLVFPILWQHVSIKGISSNYEKRNKRALTFFFVLVTLMVMFRHKTIGNDTHNYLQIFSRISEISWGSVRNVSMEKGFVYYNKLVSMLSDQPEFFLALTSALIGILMYPTYKRLNLDTSLTIVLFCSLSTFPMMFSGIRQMMAIAIGFLAYEFTRRKKLILFILMVLLAMSFHTSAFILAFMYPLYHARITRKWLFIVAPALAICFLFNRPIFTVLTLILERYTEYETEISLTGAYTMLILFGIFTAFSFLIPDEAKLDQETIGLRNFLLLSFAIQMFAPLHSLAMRMNYYYIIFIPVLIPKIIRCRSQRWNQVAMFGRHVMLAFFFVYAIAQAARGGGLNVFPYHFFWENIG